MRVLVADDQEKVRSALRLVYDQPQGMVVQGEAVNTTGLLDWAKAAAPDLVLLDWELPGPDREHLLLRLHETCPQVKVIALSGRPEAREAAVEAGADAFVSKGDPPEMLLAAIEGCRETLPARDRGDAGNVL